MTQCAFLRIAAGVATAMAVPAMAQSVTTEQLQRALHQRDEVIAALEKRIAALEGQKTTPGARIADAAPGGRDTLHFGVGYQSGR